MPTIIHKFTFVADRCTFTPGKPLLSLSIDIESLTGPSRRGCLLNPKLSLHPSRSEA